MLDICKDCNKTFESSSKYIHFCQVCRYKKQKDRVIRLGLCQKCGVNPPSDGFKFCIDCRSRLNEYNKEYNSKRSGELDTIPCDTENCSNFRHSLRSSYCKDCHKKLLCSKCNIDLRTSNSSWCLKCTGQNRTELKEERAERGICLRCGIRPALEDFQRCQECSLRESGASKKRRAIQKKEIIEALDWEPRCQECGLVSFVEVFHFDHINPSEKKYDVSSMLKNGFSKEEIIEEAIKCRLLCPTCHAIRHLKEVNSKYATN